MAKCSLAQESSSVEQEGMGTARGSICSRETKNLLYFKNGSADFPALSSGACPSPGKQAWRSSASTHPTQPGSQVKQE